MPLSTLRDTIHSEASILPTAQHLYHNGNLVTDDSKTMEELRIVDGDMLALHVRDMRGSTGVPEPGREVRRRRPGGGVYQDPEVVRLQILSSPTSRRELERQNPELAAALEDPQRFAQIVNDDIAREERQRFQRQEHIRGLNDDPFDVEKQRQIEEMIRQERVMENLQNAMEHAPEGMCSSFLFFFLILLPVHILPPLLFWLNRTNSLVWQCLEGYIYFTSMSK